MFLVKLFVSKITFSHFNFFVVFLFCRYYFVFYAFDEKWGSQVISIFTLIDIAIFQVLVKKIRRKNCDFYWYMNYLLLLEFHKKNNLLAGLIFMIKN